MVRNSTLQRSEWNKTKTHALGAVFLILYLTVPEKQPVFYNHGNCPDNRKKARKPLPFQGQ